MSRVNRIALFSDSSILNTSPMVVSNLSNGSEMAPGFFLWECSAAMEERMLRENLLWNGPFCWLNESVDACSTTTIITLALRQWELSLLISTLLAADCISFRITIASSHRGLIIMIARYRSEVLILQCYFK